MSTILQDTKLAAFRADWKQTSLPVDASVLAKANEVINTIDFPTTRTERWKYTRVTKIANRSFTLGNEMTVDKLPDLPFGDAYNFVFVNGEFKAELSGNTVDFQFESIDQSAEATNFIGKAVNLDQKVFAALNTVYANGGAFIKIGAKQVIEKPIQLVFISTGEQQAANIRNVIVADKFSQARISQVFLSVNAKECFSNVVTEYFLEDSASLVVDKIQNEDEFAYQVSLDYVKQPQNAVFKLNTITLNGALVRNNVYVDVTGQNAYTYLNGAYVLKGSQHVDNHTTIDHLAANCESDEMYKGVIDEQATAVFNGKVFVRKDAQKINAYQSNGNVLLSDSAAVNSKPELEIYADDVKCSHGSTTGQLDEEAIFYLRARGVSEKSAKALMVTAFIGDVLDRIENEEIIEYIHSVLEERFGWTF